MLAEIATDFAQSAADAQGQMPIRSLASFIGKGAVVT